MHSATPGIGLTRIEPVETEPAETDLEGTEPAGIDLVGIELVGGLGGGAAACAPPN